MYIDVIFASNIHIDTCRHTYMKLYTERAYIRAHMCRVCKCFTHSHLYAIPGINVPHIREPVAPLQFETLQQVRGSGFGVVTNSRTRQGETLKGLGCGLARAISMLW